MLQFDEIINSIPGHGSHSETVLTSKTYFVRASKHPTTHFTSLKLQPVTQIYAREYKGQLPTTELETLLISTSYGEAVHEK